MLAVGWDDLQMDASLQTPVDAVGKVENGGFTWLLAPQYPFPVQSRSVLCHQVLPASE